MAPAGFWLAIFFLLVTTVVGAYDLYALWHMGMTDTVSYHLRMWSIEFPGLPLFIGFILGHLFFPLPRWQRPE